MPIEMKSTGKIKAMVTATLFIVVVRRPPGLCFTR